VATKHPVLSEEEVFPRRHLHPVRVASPLGQDGLHLHAVASAGGQSHSLNEKIASTSKVQGRRFPRLGWSRSRRSHEIPHFVNNFTMRIKAMHRHGFYANIIPVDVSDARRQKTISRIHLAPVADGSCTITG
jgi:hypothetical protein